MTHPVRDCMGCGQRDDHPRFQDVLPDGTSAFWHHDCRHMTNGDPVAGAVAASGLKGDELRRHIVENDPAQRYLDSLNPDQPVPSATQAPGPVPGAGAGVAASGQVSPPLPGQGG